MIATGEDLSSQPFPTIVKLSSIEALLKDLTEYFLNVHGIDTIMYSRRTATSQTRIDYIFSNTGSCVYFQYIPVVGLDHVAALARYEVDFDVTYDRVPQDRRYDSWIIAKHLQNDEVILDQAELIIKKIYAESLVENLDATFHWLKLQTSLASLARCREREIRSEKVRKLHILKGFYSSILKDVEQGWIVTRN